MPIFTVVVERRGPIERTTVAVEAETDDEAKQKAVELAVTVEHSFRWFVYGLADYKSTKAVPGLCNTVIPSRIKEFNNEEN